MLTTEAASTLLTDAFKPVTEKRGLYAPAAAVPKRQAESNVLSFAAKA